MDILIEFIQQPITLILGGIFGALGLYHLLTSKKGRRSARRGGKADPLVTACLGDRQKADRLMLYEIRRQPGISKAEARQRAIERLTRDRSGYR